VELDNHPKGLAEIQTIQGSDRDRSGDDAGREKSQNVEQTTLSEWSHRSGRVGRKQQVVRPKKENIDG
jgi:hypothetical protein